MPRRTTSQQFSRPVVWVVGASRGIGRELAGAFASSGCRTCLSARNRRQLDSAVREINGLGGVSLAFPCDIADLRQVSLCARRIRRECGTIDVLINNAGVTVFKTLLRTTLRDLDAILDTNLRGHIACIKEVLPAMVKRRHGWIFNILSNAAVKTFEGSAAYTAAKQGMLGLGRVLREEVKYANVKVINVIPGATLTGMWSPAMRKKYGGRMMSAKDVAEAVLALYKLPEGIVADEILLRPVKGDLA